MVIYKIIDFKLISGKTLVPSNGVVVIQYRVITGKRPSVLVSFIKVAYLNKIKKRVETLNGRVMLQELTFCDQVCAESKPSAPIFYVQFVRTTIPAHCGYFKIQIINN